MVHFQFAPWLLRDKAGQAHVAHCVEQMEGYTVSVEFRNKTWFDEANLGRTLAFERALNVVHTVVDGPQGFHNSVPPVWESTHISYSLVRLHGRNHETWNIKGATVASERFDYDYSDAELEDVAARVERLAPETFTTHVVMNNNNEDQGQRNAATLMRHPRGEAARARAARWSRPRPSTSRAKRRAMRWRNAPPGSPRKRRPPADAKRLAPPRRVVRRLGDALRRLQVRLGAAHALAPLGRRTRAAARGRLAIARERLLARVAELRVGVAAADADGGRGPRRIGGRLRVGSTRRHRQASEKRRDRCGREAC